MSLQSHMVAIIVLAPMLSHMLRYIIFALLDSDLSHLWILGVGN